MGADLNSRDNARGLTPLYMSMLSTNYRNVATTLLEYGANLNLKYDGLTLLEKIVLSKFKSEIDEMNSNGIKGKRRKT